MRQINCYIPIKLCITGRLSDAQLDKLGEDLMRALAARISFAERTMTAHYGQPMGGSFELLRGGYDPAREDAATEGYFVPSYDDQGQRKSIPVRGQTHGKPWFIRKAINFQAYVDRFLDVVENWNPIPERDLYRDLEHELRWVSVSLVQVNRKFLFNEFFEILYQRAQKLSRVRSNQGLFAVGATHEDLRQQLIDIDESHVVAREIPNLEHDTGKIKQTGNDARLLPGARLLFASMVVPKIELKDRAELGGEIQVSVRLRDLKFLINFAALFERRFALPWDAYAREYGDQPATVHLQPVTVRQRTDYFALQYLLEQVVSQRLKSGPETFVYGRLYVLNNATLGPWPAAVRDNAKGITNDATLRLDEKLAAGVLEPNWKAAYVYSVLTISSKSIYIARYRPSVGGDVDRLIPFMSERLVTAEEKWRFRDFVKNNLYGFFPPMFEVLLDELKRRDNGKWFGRFFEAIKEAEYYELRLSVIRSAKETKYANDPVVLDLVSHHNRIDRKLSTGNVYNVEDNKLILNKLFGDTTVSVNDVLYDRWDTYFYNEDRYRPKSTFIPIWETELLRERLELIGRIEKGEDPQGLGSGYTDIEFADAVFRAVVQRIGITENNISNYFDTVTFQFSVRFLGLIKKTDPLGLETITVLYRVVEREAPIVVGTFPAVTIKVGPWKDTGDILEATVFEFDSMIDGWVNKHVAEIIITIAHAALAVAAIGVAWEFRTVQILTRIAGGAKVVIASIVLSTILEVIHNGFTFESFLLGAIDGYLGALFFRGAGGLARGFFGRSITTATFRDGLLRWIGGRVLFIGSVGGGSSAAAIRFNHDVYAVATGRGTWSSPADYAESIGWGAAIGVGIEFAGPLVLEPVAARVIKSGLSIGGKAVDIARLLRENGVSLERWRTWKGQVLSKMKQNLSQLMESQPGKAATITDGFNTLFEQVDEAYAKAPKVEPVKPRARIPKIGEPAIGPRKFKFQDKFRREPHELHVRSDGIFELCSDNCGIFEKRIRERLDNLVGGPPWGDFKDTTDALISRARANDVASVKAKAELDALMKLGEGATEAQKTAAKMLDEKLETLGGAQKKIEEELEVIEELASKAHDRHPITGEPKVLLQPLNPLDFDPKTLKFTDPASGFAKQGFATADAAKKAFEDAEGTSLTLDPSGYTKITNAPEGWKGISQGHWGVYNQAGKYVGTLYENVYQGHTFYTFSRGKH